MRPTLCISLSLTCLLAVLHPSSAALGQCNIAPYTSGIVGSPNGGYLNFGAIEALEVFDNGSGPVLYAGGDYSSIDGVPAVDIARWDGNSWTPLGSGIGGSQLYTGILAIEQFDDGSGPAIYVGGIFSTAGGVPANSVAKWDGNNWSAVGNGFFDAISPSNPGHVYDLHVWDDGNGPALYASGQFGIPGLTAGYSIAKWDGTTWSPVGGGTLAGVVLTSMVSFNDGSGSALYVTGKYLYAPHTIGGIYVDRVARWDGSAWSALGNTSVILGNGNSKRLAVYTDASGPALYAGGDFSAIYGVYASGIAKYQNGTWSAVPGSCPNGCHVEAFEVFDDGTGPALYVGGYGLPSGGTNFAKWDGSSWTHPNNGPVGNQHIREMAVMQMGGSPSLLLDGVVFFAGGLAAWTGCNNSITSQMIQAGGPGGPVYVTNTNLHPGAEYYNIFSVEPCAGGVGTGPYLGLCASPGPNLQFLIFQALLPLGVAPFHIAAPSSYVSFGPFYLPPGAALESVCLEFTGGTLGAISPVSSIVVQ